MNYYKTKNQMDKPYMELEFTVQLRLLKQRLKKPINYYEQGIK